MQRPELVMPAREIFRASRLDDFRDYLSGETFAGEEYTTEAFIARLCGREETAKMAAGTAVHKALEMAVDGDLAGADVNGWTITFDMDGALSLPRLREIPLSRRYGDVTLFGRVDAITGTTVYDHKTTQAFDADRYADSYQWRAYLAISGRDRFVYELFKAKVDEDARTVVITDHISLSFHRYPALEADVAALVARMAEVVADLGIRVQEAA